jgi:hypothetical protein
MILMAGWSARALAKLVGEPIPTVTSWVNSGLVTPEHFGRGRSGHVIGINGLMELLAVIEMRAAGFNARDIKRTVDNLRELSGQSRPLAKLCLLVEGDDIVWIDADNLSNKPISAFRNPGQRLMMFPIGEKHREYLQILAARSPKLIGVPKIDIGDR